ncbi:Uncharacterised protein [Mycobacteroides abscessus subsp. abscessus]|nr:Uncharacterised protein [Mycobacteroides abscessus subsp. abscessus]
MNAALTPPRMRETNRGITDCPRPNKSSEALKMNRPITIILFLPNWSAHLPAIGDTISWAPAKAAII